MFRRRAPQRAPRALPPARGGAPFLRPARVGLIGARRERQGLGPFVARDLVAAGADVACVLGTRAETVAQAQKQLRENAGIDARGYTRIEEMLRTESLDALAVLSPSTTHEAYLKAAAEAGLHVLCEKPLVWGGEDLASRARDCIEAFGSRGLLLAENCQWPYTLEAFDALHPGARAGAPRSFRMRLSPTSTGVDQLGDCLPHPLSLLQALAPADRAAAESVVYTALCSDGSAVGIAFDYVAGPTRVSVEVELRQGRELPRPASYTIDGHHAEREIELPAYAQRFRDGEREVGVPDPLNLRVAAFVADLDAVRSGSAPPDPEPMAQRMALLEVLLDAYSPSLDEPKG